MSDETWIVTNLIFALARLSKVGPKELMEVAHQFDANREYAKQFMQGEN